MIGLGEESGLQSYDEISLLVVEPWAVNSTRASPEGWISLPSQWEEGWKGCSGATPPPGQDSLQDWALAHSHLESSLCSREGSGPLHRHYSPLPLPWPQGSFLGLPGENLVGLLEVKPRTVWMSPDTMAPRNFFTQGCPHSGSVIRQYHQSVPASSHPHLLLLQVSRSWSDPLHPLSLHILRWCFVCIFISWCLQAKLILVCSAFPDFMDGSESQTL